MDLNSIGELIERFGLPLIAFLGIAIGGYRGWIRSGPQVDRDLEERQRETNYREALRLEEKARSDRLESALALTVTAIRDMTDTQKGMVEILKDVERAVDRGK